MTDTTTKTEEQEYDSGYRDGAAGLSIIEGESEAWVDGYFEGARRRAEQQLALRAVVR